MTSRQVLVTGGAGFIGAAVVRALRHDGHAVVVVDSLRPDVHRDGGAAAGARLTDLDAELVVADVRDGEAWRTALTVSDVVVHLAAKFGLGVDIDDMDDCVSSNALGTAVVLRQCAVGGVRRVVQASSMVVYGEGRYTCEDHGVVPPGPRRTGDLEQGRFEPPCPACDKALTPASSPRRRPWTRAIRTP